MNILDRLTNTFVFACVSPIAPEWIIEYNDKFYTISQYIVSNAIAHTNSSNELKRNLIERMNEIKLCDVGDQTLVQLRERMETNGYSYSDPTQFGLKNNQPCYIAENAEDLNDVESWLSMYIKTYKTLLNKDHLINVCESYDQDVLITIIEADQKDFKITDYQYYYKKATQINLSEYVSNTIESFFSDTEQWTFLNTYLNQ